MEAKQYSSKFLQRRKFLLVLPLLVLPFILILFVILGGGKGNEAETASLKGNTGINTKLPDAHFKKGKATDKLGLYDLANRDSVKRKEAIQNDPYYHLDSLTGLQESGFAGDSRATFLPPDFRHAGPDQSKLASLDGKPQVKFSSSKVMERLEQLKKIVSERSDTPGKTDLAKPPKRDFVAPQTKSVSEPDPEMARWNSMLDKIIAIQYPETMKDSIRKLSLKNRRQVFYVGVNPNESNVSVLGAADPETRPFYNLDEDSSHGSGLEQNAIEAIVNETQTLVSGDPITIRLLNDIFVDGIRIPKNQLLTGMTSLSNERLKITVSAISYQNNIFPVSLEVYDRYGLPGIYIPGSANLEAGKQSTGQVVGSLGLPTLDPSIGAQAASAGIQAAKTLVGKRIRVVKFTVRAGYPVLLKDGSPN